MDPANGNLDAQFSLEGFDLGYYNKDTPPKLYASAYDDDDLTGFVMFAGSWSYFNRKNYRFVLFKAYTSEDILSTEEDDNCVFRDSTFGDEENLVDTFDEVDEDYVTMTEFTSTGDNPTNSDFYIGDLDFDYRDRNQLCQDSYEPVFGSYNMLIGDQYQQYDSVDTAVGAEAHKFVTDVGGEVAGQHEFNP